MSALLRVKKDWNGRHGALITVCSSVRVIRFFSRQIITLWMQSDVFYFGLIKFGINQRWVKMDFKITFNGDFGFKTWMGVMDRAMFVSVLCVCVGELLSLFFLWSIGPLNERIKHCLYTKKYWSVWFQELF